MNDRVTSRRTLLKAGGGSLLVAGLGLAPAAQAAQGSGSFAWSRAGAERLAGQVFWLNHPEHRALQIKLEAVEAAAGAGRRGRQTIYGGVLCRRAAGN